MRVLQLKISNDFDPVHSPESSMFVLKSSKQVLLTFTLSLLLKSHSERFFRGHQHLQAVFSVLLKPVYGREEIGMIVGGLSNQCRRSRLYLEINANYFGSLHFISKVALYLVEIFVVCRLHLRR